MRSLHEKIRSVSHRGRGDEEHAEGAEKSQSFVTEFLSASLAIFPLRTWREKKRIHAEGAEIKIRGEGSEVLWILATFYVNPTHDFEPSQTIAC